MFLVHVPFAAAGILPAELGAELSDALAGSFQSSFAGLVAAGQRHHYREDRVHITMVTVSRCITAVSGFTAQILNFVVAVKQRKCRITPKKKEK